MNSPKVVVALGLVLISSLILTACGGGSKAPTPTPSAPTIQTLILPQGAVNAPYNAVFSATGGSGNYSWSITAGSLPPGLSLNASQGTISGTPTTLGNYPFTVMVTDTSTNLTASTKLSIYIEGVVVVSSTCGESKVADFCPSGAMNVAYTNPDGTAVQLTASGGLCPFKWAVSSGSLPAGLSLAAGTCANSKGTAVISGTPTMDGAPATLNVSVTDSETSPGVPAVGSGQFTITIMSITTTSLPAGYLNSPYTGSFTVAGGSTPYTWTWSAATAAACRRA